MRLLLILSVIIQRGINMKYFKISIVIDGLFVLLTTFLIAFVILNSYFNKTFAFIMALLIGVVIFLFLYFLLIRKNSAKLLKKQEEKNMENVLCQLAMNSKSQNTVLFERAFTKLNISYVKRKEGIFLTDSKALVLLEFRFDGFSKADVVRAYNKIDKNEKVYILSNNFSQEIRDFAERFNKKVVLISNKNVYNFLVKADSLPKITLVLEKAKTPIKLILKEFFTKKRARGYFAVGLVTLLFSLVVPFKVYYVVFGSILLLISLVCRFYGKTIQEEKDFDF